MENDYKALKNSAVKITPDAAKLTDAQAAYFAGWVDGAIAMARQDETHNDEARKGA